MGAMERGGVETWLMQVLRHIDRERFHVDFLVHTTEKCVFDDEIRSLGSRVIPCLAPSQPISYARNFFQAVQNFGPYDIIHSNVHTYSGYVLRLARRAGIPVRIAHSHSDTSGQWANASWLRRLYLTSMRNWIYRYATDGLAASHEAAAALFGHTWESDFRWRILYCGIDLTPFEAEVNKADVRAELGIPLDAKVIGHVGGFRAPKNHEFLVEIAEETSKRDPRVCFLLVGDGPLRVPIERDVVGRGLSGKVIFAGQRADVPRLMLGGMDVFLLPSTYEGLPLVLLEAQAAGLPYIVSTTVTDEVDWVEDLSRRLPLSDPASVWAEELLDVLACLKKHGDNSRALAALERSAFSIRNSTKNIEKLYWECCKRHKIIRCED